MILIIISRMSWSRAWRSSCTRGLDLSCMQHVCAVGRVEAVCDSQSVPSVHELVLPHSAQHARTLSSNVSYFSQQARQRQNMLAALQHLFAQFGQMYAQAQGCMEKLQGRRASETVLKGSVASPHQLKLKK